MRSGGVASICSIKTKTPLYNLIGVTMEKCELLSQVCVLEVQLGL